MQFHTRRPGSTKANHTYFGAPPSQLARQLYFSGGMCSASRLHSDGEMVAPALPNTHVRLVTPQQNSGVQYLQSDLQNLGHRPTVQLKNHPTAHSFLPQHLNRHLPESASYHCHPADFLPPCAPAPPNLAPPLPHHHRHIAKSAANTHYHHPWS